MIINAFFLNLCSNVVELTQNNSAHFLFTRTQKLLSHECWSCAHRYPLCLCLENQLCWANNHPVQRLVDNQTVQLPCSYRIMQVALSFMLPPITVLKMTDHMLIQMVRSILSSGWYMITYFLHFVHSVSFPIQTGRIVVGLSE